MALAPSLVWLFVGRVISGITSASVSTAFAYIADVTPAERRAAVFGMLGAAFGVGFIVGPALGGLLGGMDLAAAVLDRGGAQFRERALRLSMLPESLPPERRSPFRWKKRQPARRAASAALQPHSCRAVAGEFLRASRACGAAVHLRLYATYRYAADTPTVGFTLALVGVSAMVVQGVGVGPIVKRLGERRARSRDLPVARSGFYLWHSPDRSAVLDRHSLVMSLWGVAGAAIQALTTQPVAPDQQGQLQGATSVNSIAQMIGPFLFTLTFALFHQRPGAGEITGCDRLVLAAKPSWALRLRLRGGRSRSNAAT